MSRFRKHSRLTKSTFGHALGHVELEALRLLVQHEEGTAAHTLLDHLILDARWWRRHRRLPGDDGVGRASRVQRQQQVRVAEALTERSLRTCGADERDRLQRLRDGLQWLRAALRAEDAAEQHP